MPTIVTSPPDIVRRAQRTLAHPPLHFKGALPLGLHVEGPFINPQKKGAHNAAHIRLPDSEQVGEWSPQNGIRMVTLAPELPNASETIHTLVKNHVIVSAGHSLASWEEARYGIEAGISCGTHLFNAMPPLDHRNPGLVAALLASQQVCFGLIVDGLHVHPGIISLVWQLAKAQRLYLVTDAMSALGMPPGEYNLGDLKVMVDNVSARLPEGSLAGSVLSLDQAVRNLLQFTGCTLLDAICSVTDTPAAILGETGKRGRIIPGGRGDLVVLTPDLQVGMTFVAGQLVYEKSHTIT